MRFYKVISPQAWHQLVSIFDCRDRSINKKNSIFVTVILISSFKNFKIFFLISNMIIFCLFEQILNNIFYAYILFVCQCFIIKIKNLSPKLKLSDDGGPIINHSDIEHCFYQKIELISHTHSMDDRGLIKCHKLLYVTLMKLFVQVCRVVKCKTLS